MMAKHFSLLFFLLLSLPSWALENLSTTKQAKPFFDIDIAGSVGNYNGKSYTETHIGLNLNFTDWFTWRNSAFKRISANSETAGLDSSARFSFETSDINIYGGPGYRWADSSDRNALFAEAGAALHVFNVTMGGGVKYLLYDKAQYSSSGAELKRDDLSFYITLSASTGASF